MRAASSSGRGKRWSIAAAAVLILAAMLLIAFPRGSRTTVVAMARVTRGDLSATILCDGLLEPPPGGELRAPEAATIGTIVAAEGSAVRKGDPLVRLENPELSESARAAAATVARLTAERAASEARLAEARREAERQERIVRSDERLGASGTVSKAEAEADAATLARLRGELAALEDAVSGPGGAELDLARQSAEELARRTAALTLRAPIEGVVYGLPAKPGVPVAAGDLIASVSNRRSLRVRARVDEPDLPGVRPGNRFLITFDGLPGQSWSGVVREVSMGLREVSGRRVGEVVGEFPDRKGVLPPNASVNVSIVTGETRGALLVPRAAILPDDGGRAVYIFADGRARRKNISVGLLGTTQAQVTEGLSEGDRVILPGNAPLSDGLAVSAAESSRP